MRRPTFGVKLLRQLASLCLLMGCGSAVDDPVDGAVDGPADTAADTALDGDSPSGEVDWFCDWDFGTGASETQVRGTDAPLGTEGLSECFGYYTSVSGLGTMAEVVPKPTMGSAFPDEMTNVYRVALLDTFGEEAGSMSFMVQNEDGWPALEIGQSMFIRSYDRFDIAVGESTNTHVLHIGQNADPSRPYRWWLIGPSSPVADDGSMTMDVQTNRGAENDSGPGEGRFRDFLSTQRAGQVYRRELRITRESADSGRVAYRVFDQAGTQILDETLFTCAASGQPNGCMGASPANPGYRTKQLGEDLFTIDNWDDLRSIELGNNGSSPGGGDPSVLTYWYWGGLAVRISDDPDDWIGPYPTGAEIN